jgi:hypothetical protein
MKNLCAARIWLYCRHVFSKRVRKKADVTIRLVEQTRLTDDSPSVSLFYIFDSISSISASMDSLSAEYNRHLFSIICRPIYCVK